jgi:hypothetical protein
VIANLSPFLCAIIAATLSCSIRTNKRAERVRDYLCEKGDQMAIHDLAKKETVHGTVMAVWFDSDDDSFAAQPAQRGGRTLGKRSAILRVDD